MAAQSQDFLVDFETVIAQENEYRQGYADGPERALLVALLFDAVQAYLNYFKSEQIPKRQRDTEALNWINSFDRSYVFSFENVCEALGIDSSYLRYGLVNAVNS